MLNDNNINDSAVQLWTQYASGVWANITHENNYNEALQKRGDCKDFDPESVQEMIYKFNDSKIIIVPMFDIHVGGEGFDAERFKMVLNFLYNVRIAKGFFGGDLFDNANLEGKTNPLLSRLTPWQQKQYLNNLPELKNCLELDKILFCLYGNHDGLTNDRTKNAAVSLVQDFCMQNQIRFAPYNALLNIEIPVSGNRKQVQSFRYFSTHGSSKTADPAVACESEKEKMINAMRSANMDPSTVDCASFGHLHIDGAIPFPITTNNYDEEGKLVGTIKKTLWMFCEPPMQSVNDFAIRANMKSSGTNCYATELQWEKNPRYKGHEKNEMPYKLRVNRFPILENNQNKYSSFAEQYLLSDLYKEPHEIKEELEEKYLNNSTDCKDFISALYSNKL